METNDKKQTQSTEATATGGTANKLDSETTLSQMVYVREVCVRYSGPRRKRVQIKSPSDAKQFLDGVQKDNSREHFMALFLDGAHQVVSYATISTGTANSTLVHAREIFQAAIVAGSAALIVAHNHPSGKLDPSEEDRHITKDLVAAGQLLGIPVLDHLILSDDAFFSFGEAGEMG